jgi:S-DNA-T family DNA segregation ATPase FtsK/SpoIIIE
MNTNRKPLQLSMAERLSAAVSDLDAIAAQQSADLLALKADAVRKDQALAQEQAEALRPSDALKSLQKAREKYQRELSAIPTATGSRDGLKQDLTSLESKRSCLRTSHSSLQSELDGLRQASAESTSLLDGFRQQHSSLNAQISNRHLIIQLVKLLFGDVESARRDELAREISKVGMRQQDIIKALDAANQRQSVLEHELRGIERELGSLEKQIQALEEAIDLQQKIADAANELNAAELQERKRIELVMEANRTTRTALSVARSAREAGSNRDFQQRWRKGLEVLDDLCRRVRRRQPRLDEIQSDSVAPDGLPPDALALGRLRLSWETWTGSIPRLTAFPIQKALWLPVGAADGMKKLEALALRLITALPCGGIRILACDPRHLGQSLGLLRPLLKVPGPIVNGRVLTRADKIERALEIEAGALEDILQARFKEPEMHWAKYNKEHPDTPLEYRMLLLFDVPDQLTEKSLHYLGRLVEHGPRCGLLPVLVMHDGNQDNRRYTQFREATEPFLQDLRTIPSTAFPALKCLNIEERPEPIPNKEKLEGVILAVVNRYEGQSLRTKPIGDLWKDAALWSGSSASGLRAPIGWQPDGTPVHFEIGGVGTEHHALLAGRSGSGKSNLLHVLMHSLCHRYPPEQFRVFLLDYKQGTELSVYSRPALPHAALVATESDPEYGVTVLEHLAAEIDRRASEFKKIGVRDLITFSERSTVPMCRWLLIIDEFQVLFSEGRQVAEPAERLLTKLLRQGRAYGLHVLLATQTLKGIQTQSMSQLSSQIGLRLCLACGEEDSAAILSATNWAGSMLKSPPEAIINNTSGSKDGNILFRVPRADDDTCSDHLQEIIDAAFARGISSETKIFDGSHLPPIPSSRGLAHLVQTEPRPTLIIGLRLDYEAAAMPCPLAKRHGSNLLCVGPDPAIRMGLLHAVVRSFAAQAGAVEVLFISSRHEEERANITAICPSNVRCTILPEDWTAEAEQSSPNQATGHRLLLIDGLDYARAFQSGGLLSSKSSAQASALRKWLEESPQQGCWTVAFADNWGRIASSCKELLPSFQLRIGFCLNEDHAGALASGGFEKLKGADLPHRAFFVDQHQNLRSWFRPFSPIATTVEENHG